MIDKIIKYYSEKYEDIKVVLDKLILTEIKMEFIRLSLKNNKEVYLMEADSWDYNSYYRLKVVEFIDFDKGCLYVEGMSISTDIRRSLKEVNVRCHNIEEIYLLNRK